jgi:hypothetical protein
VLVPTRCPSGIHVLANDGYRIRETGQTLHVSCQACVDVARADHGWSLKTDGRETASAAFDDRPYADLLKNAVQR